MGDYSYYISSNGGGFSGTSNPLSLSGKYQNNVQLQNARIKTQGWTMFKIHTQTDCDLGLNYQSYTLENYDIGELDSSGTNFNYQTTRFLYGIGDTNINLADNTNYYDVESLPTSGGWVWTPLTASYTAGPNKINVSGTVNINIPSNKYLMMVLTGPATDSVSYNNTGMIIITGLPTANGFCVGADSQILMGDKTYKAIKDIKRNDVVIQDIESGTTAIVSKVYNSQVSGEMVKIPAGLIGNKDYILCSQLHPIWIGENRIYAKDLNGVEIINCVAELYNLQYDEEGTFIVDGVKIDSLSPYHKYSPLPKDEFLDSGKYIAGRKVKDENDPLRNKPLLKLNKKQ